jgi:hypothetical protein
MYNIELACRAWLYYLKCSSPYSRAARRTSSLIKHKPLPTPHIAEITTLPLSPLPIFFLTDSDDVLLHTDKRDT